MRMAPVARQAEDRDLINRATEIRLRAEIRAGETVHSLPLMSAREIL
jgi:hypothetical protein